MTTSDIPSLTPQDLTRVALERIHATRDTAVERAHKTAAWQLEGWAKVRDQLVRLGPSQLEILQRMRDRGTGDRFRYERFYSVPVYRWEVVQGGGLSTSWTVEWYENSSNAQLRVWLEGNWDGNLAVRPQRTGAPAFDRHYAECLSKEEDADRTTLLSRIETSSSWFGHSTGNDTNALWSANAEAGDELLVALQDSLTVLRFFDQVAASFADMAPIKR